MADTHEEQNKFGLDRISILDGLWWARVLGLQM